MQTWTGIFVERARKVQIEIYQSSACRRAHKTMQKLIIKQTN
jgi:hypothetical protein